MDDKVDVIVNVNSNQEKKNKTRNQPFKAFNTIQGENDHPIMGIFKNEEDVQQAQIPVRLKIEQPTHAKINEDDEYKCESSGRDSPTSSIEKQLELIERRKDIMNLQRVSSRQGNKMN